MVLGGKEHGVEDDTEGDQELKEWITHHLVQTVLEAEPALVVYTTLHTLITVTVD